MITYVGTLINLDGQPDTAGDVLDADTSVELPSHQVKVTLNFDHREEFVLGRAKLFIRPSKICYRMDIDDSKLPEYALRDLVPCAGGVVMDRNGKHIKHIFLTSIGLSEAGNADPRIQPIGEQK
jgi:hypothetical protein